MNARFACIEILNGLFHHSFPTLKSSFVLYVRIKAQIQFREHMPRARNSELGGFFVRSFPKADLRFKTAPPHIPCYHTTQEEPSLYD